jgi:serine protease
MARLGGPVTFGAALLGVFGMLAVSGRGQDASPPARTIVSMDAPPAIERGISPDPSAAQGAPEQSRRQSVQSTAAPADRTGVAGTRYRPGRVIVKFRDGLSAAARVQALTAVSRTATMAARSASQNFDVVQMDASGDAEATAAAFRARSDVEYAQAAYRVRPLLVPNDFYYPCQWGLPLIDMERAWDVQPAAGSAITVAVVDTGVAYTAATVKFHANAFTVDNAGNIGPVGSGGTLYPALGDLSLPFVAATELAPLTRFVAPRDFIWNDTLPVDLEGHGTHVSGTIGQLTNNRGTGLGDVTNLGGTAGVAFNVKLMPVKVISGEWDEIFGAPNAGTDDVVALGIRYAADNGAKIINMSIGRSGPSTCGTNPSQNGCAPVVEDAVKYAVGKGVFVAIAAGNGFQTGNPTEVLAEIASRVPGAVSVAAVNQFGGHASYSSTGSWVELAAPGGDSDSRVCNGQPKLAGVLQQTLDLDVVDTFDLAPAKFGAPRFDTLAYYFFTGTSMATPHVSGLAAMLMQQGITDPAAIEAALERFAIPCSESRNVCDASVAANRNATFGYGLVQGRAALRGLGLAR